MKLKSLLMKLISLGRRERERERARERGFHMSIEVANVVLQVKSNTIK